MLDKRITSFYLIKTHATSSQLYTLIKTKQKTHTLSYSLTMVCMFSIFKKVISADPGISFTSSKPLPVRAFALAFNFGLASNIFKLEPGTVSLTATSILHMNSLIKVRVKGIQRKKKRPHTQVNDLRGMGVVQPQTIFMNKNLIRTIHLYSKSERERERVDLVLHIKIQMMLV